MNSVQNPCDIPWHLLVKRDPHNGLLKLPYKWVVYILLYIFWKINPGLNTAHLNLPKHTVDGSELRRSPPGMFLKPCKFL